MFNLLTWRDQFMRELCSGSVICVGHRSGLQNLILNAVRCTEQSARTREVARSICENGLSSELAYMAQCLKEAEATSRPARRQHIIEHMLRRTESLLVTIGVSQFSTTEETLCIERELLTLRRQASALAERDGD